jgi:hypothetical protein
MPITPGPAANHAHLIKISHWVYKKLDLLFIYLYFSTPPNVDILGGSWV